MKRTLPAPLKILQIASTFDGWGGTEMHLLNLSSQLVQRGHSVTVACRPGGFVAEDAERRGLRIAPLTSRKRVDFAAGRAYERLIAEERFDVVHAHWKPDYLMGPLVARRKHVPVIVMSCHSPYPPASPLLRFLYGNVIYDQIIAVSDSVRRALVGSGLPNSKTVTVHHGTDTTAFIQAASQESAQKLRVAWGVPEQAFLAGMAGRISEEKGALDFLRALARCPAIHGVLLGDGPQRAEAEQFAAENGLTGRVTFAGFRSDIADAMGALDVLVLASTWAEPCAAVVQQAMALGKPVIGTDIGGTPEMIVEGVTGCLVPPGDSDALASALESLSRDPARCAAMGAAGKD